MFALVVTGSVGMVSGCAGGGSQETVMVASTQWVDPDSGSVVKSAEVAEAEDAPVVVDSNGDLFVTGNVEGWSTEQARNGRPAPADEARTTCITCWPSTPLSTSRQ